MEMDEVKLATDITLVDVFSVAHPVSLWDKQRIRARSIDTGYRCVMKKQCSHED